MKLVIKVRWNSLGTHLKPFVNEKNWKTMIQVVALWRSQRKFTDLEKTHNYQALQNNQPLVKELSETLNTIKESFALLETDNATLHRVLPVIHMLLNGGQQLVDGKLRKVPPPFRAKKADSTDLKKLKELLYWKLQTNVLDHLLPVHWMTAILCPFLREHVKNEKGGFLTNYKKRGKRDAKVYNRYNEAVRKLKGRVREVIEKTRARAEQNESQQDDRQRGEAALGTEPPEKRRRLSVDPSSLVTPKPSKSKSMFVFSMSLKKKRKGRANMSPDRVEASKEVELYLTRPWGQLTLKRSFENPLQFWLDAENQDLFPNLSKVALQILTIPSTSAAVERLFSLAGNF